MDQLMRQDDGTGLWPARTTQEAPELAPSGKRETWYPEIEESTLNCMTGKVKRTRKTEPVS